MLESEPSTFMSTETGVPVELVPEPPEPFSAPEVPVVTETTFETLEYKNVLPLWAKAWTLYP
jgi:hypothetical protein